MSSNPVPWLRSGTGSTPSEGGCIMQVIDWISSGGWTDKPACVNPVLRELAIRANDQLDDNGRQKLLVLAPRLMNTMSHDRKLNAALAIFVARKVLHIYEERFPGDDRPRKAIETAEKGDTSAAAAAYAAYAAAYAAYAAASAANANAAYAAASAANANAASAANANAAYAAAYAAANAANAAADAAANAAADAAANAAYAAAYAAAAAAAAYELLVDTLAEYERLTHHEQEEITTDQWQAVCAVMA